MVDTGPLETLRTALRSWSTTGELCSSNNFGMTLQDHLMAVNSFRECPVSQWRGWTNLTRSGDYRKIPKHVVDFCGTKGGEGHCVLSERCWQCSSWGGQRQTQPKAGPHKDVLKGDSREDYEISINQSIIPTLNQLCSDPGWPVGDSVHELLDQHRL